MKYTEQRMNKVGRIRIVSGRSLHGIPIAVDKHNDRIITYSKLSRRMKAFLEEDGLTLAEIKNWLSKYSEMELDSYLDVFHTFSRSLDWGFAQLTANKELPDTLKNGIKAKDIATNINKFNSNDLLVTRKLKIDYTLETQAKKIQSDYEEIHVHLLIGTKPSYRGISIVDGMTPFNSDDSSIGLQIVEGNNPLLYKSLSRITGFAYTLDSFKHDDAFDSIDETYPIYELWNNPKTILISNQEIPSTILLLYQHASEYLDMIERILKEWIQSIGPFNHETVSDELEVLFRTAESIISWYLSMQNLRLP